MSSNSVLTIHNPIDEIDATGCEYCSNVSTPFEIKSPQDLREIILKVHECMNDNTLIEVENKQNREVLGIQPFEKVPCNGPWNDFCSHYFKCTHCNTYFLLNVETYNGSGGNWEPFFME
jgi:hypothetical protein